MADGVMHFVGRLASGLRDLAAIREACTSTGRDPATLYATSFTVGCVLRDDEPADSARARAQAGPFAMTFFHALADGSLPMRVPTRLQPAVEAYRRLYRTYEPADARYLTLHKGHFMRVRPEEEAFLDADLLRDLSFTARAEELRERFRALRDAGCRQVAICLIPGQEAALDDWARVIEKV